MPDSLFSAVCKYAPVGLMVLDADARVVHLNAFLKSILSLPPGGYKGRPFGGALHCASAAGTGLRCGDTPACAGCILRRGIMDALAHGQPVRCAVLSHTFVINGTPVAKTLRFSVAAADSKQGCLAVVSFLDITREQQYERLLARELNLEAISQNISPQNLVGIVAGLMQQAGSNSLVSVGMATLEGLKRPDFRGEMTEDEALQRFVEIARQCTRRDDVIGHYGASFIFMFPGAGIHMAATIIKRIYNTMAAVFAAYGASGISFSAGFMELKSSDLTQTAGSDVIRTVEGFLNTARHRGGSLFVSHERTARLKA